MEGARLDTWTTGRGQKPARGMMVAWTMVVGKERSGGGAGIYSGVQLLIGDTR